MTIGRQAKDIYPTAARTGNRQRQYHRVGTPQPIAKKPSLSMTQQIANGEHPGIYTCTSADGEASIVLQCKNNVLEIVNAKGRYTRFLQKISGTIQCALLDRPSGAPQVILDLIQVVHVAEIVYEPETI